MLVLTFLHLIIILSMHSNYSSTDTHMYAHPIKIMHTLHAHTHAYTVHACTHTPTQHIHPHTAHLGEMLEKAVFGFYKRWFNNVRHVEKEKKHGV